MKANSSFKLCPLSDIVNQMFLYTDSVVVLLKDTE